MLFFTSSVISSCGFHSPVGDVSLSVVFPCCPPSCHACPCHCFLCFTSESIFFISSRIDFAISNVGAILQSALATSSTVILCYLSLFFSFSISFSIIPLCVPLELITNGAPSLHPLLGNLYRAVEQCLDWMCLALLSILCYAKKKKKILMHSTVNTDWQSIRMVVLKYTDALCFHQFQQCFNVLSTNYSAPII